MMFKKSLFLFFVRACVITKCWHFAYYWDVKSLQELQISRQRRSRIIYLRHEEPSKSFKKKKERKRKVVMFFVLFFLTVLFSIFHRSSACKSSMQLHLAFGVIFSFLFCFDSDSKQIKYVERYSWCPCARGISGSVLSFSEDGIICTNVLHFFCRLFLF